MEIFNLIGSLVTLALVIAAIGGMTKALIVRVWEQGLKDKQVDSDEAYRAMFSVFAKLFSFARTHMLATVSSVAMFLASLVQDAGFHASMGFSAVVFTIATIITPLMMRALRASALCFVLLLSKQKNTRIQIIS
ncbi:hypothetical protein D3C71_20940 [compost metagenome]